MSDIPISGISSERDSSCVALEKNRIFVSDVKEIVPLLYPGGI